MDYVLVRRRDQRDVLVTKSIPGADGWTDYRLVISEKRICLQSRSTPQVQSTALAVLGRAGRHHRDCFDDNDAAISNLLTKKNCLHRAYVDRPTDSDKVAFYRSRSHAQQLMREIKDVRTARKAQEIQEYANLNEWKNFSASKTVYGPPAKATTPLLSVDGSTLITEKTKILQRWAEHFRIVLK
ncbi:hypothetical protein SprV_0200763500 [Sparganum proliferum]